MRTLGQILLAVIGIAAIGWVNWARIEYDYAWYKGNLVELKKTGSKYKLVKAVYIEKPWTWFYPTVEAVNFFRPTEIIDSKATFGVAGRIYNASGRVVSELFYVYIDCDKRLVKEVDATNIPDEEAEKQILSALNLEMKDGQWSPKQPFVIARRFYADVCEGRDNGYHRG